MNNTKGEKELMKGRVRVTRKRVRVTKKEVTSHQKRRQKLLKGGGELVVTKKGTIS